MKNGVSFSPKSSLTKLLTILTLIGTTNNALAQNLASREKTKDGIENTNGVKNNINIRNTEDPIGYAFDNIEKYYPDMKTSHPEVAQHLAKLRQELNGPRGKIQKQEVNKIFKSIQRKNTYGEKNIVTFIVSVTEGDVIQKGATFSDTYRSEDYTQEEQQYYDFFSKTYTDRFNAYEKEFNERLLDLQKRIKDIEENNERDIVQISKSLETFSIEEIKQNPTAYETMKKIKKIFEKRGRKKTTHIEEIFSIIK